MSTDIGKAYFHGLLYAFLAYATVSIGDAFTKKALEIHDMIYVAFYSNLFIIVCLLALAPFKGGYKVLIKTKQKRLHALRGLIFLGVSLSFLYAISNLTIAKTYTLYLTQPFILVLLAHFFTKEYIGAHRIASIIISFAGVLIVLRPGFVPLDLAAVSALLCALLFASGNIIVKFIDKNDYWMTFVFFIMLVQTPLLGAYLIATGGFEPPFPVMEAVYWIAAGGVFYVFALAYFPLALQRIDAAMFGAIEYTVIIWGTIFGYFLFSEVPDIWTIGGAAIIVASGLYLVYRERKANHVIKELEGI